jgi:hypothetical protein
MQTFVAGSGVFNPFLTVQNNGNEMGYNTSLGGSNPNFDAKRGASGVTQALLLSNLQLVSAANTGVPGLTSAAGYYVFRLDINTAGGPGDNLMTLNQVQIFQSTSDRNDGTVTGGVSTWTDPLHAPVLSFPSVAGNSTTEVFRWNNADDTFPPGTATQVLLNGNFHQGSGEFDMLLFVDASSFDPAKGNSLQFFSQFGNPPNGNPTTDGFEEWAALQGAGTIVPVPPGAVLALAGMIPLGIGVLRRRRSAAA